MDSNRIETMMPRVVKIEISAAPSSSQRITRSVMLRARSWGRMTRTPSAMPAAATASTAASTMAGGASISPSSWPSAAATATTSAGSAAHTTANQPY